MCRSRTKNVEADARDNGRKPGTEILYGIGLGPAQSKPCFLYGIIGFGLGSEHAGSDGAEVFAVLFELFS